MEQGFNLTKKIHTEVLREKYGPIHSEIIQHNDNVREMHMLDEKNISRTYAITFPIAIDRSNEELVEIDREIKNGGLIGETFKKHGYEVRKNVISVFVTEFPDFLKKKMQMEGKEIKVRLSEFYAKKEGGNPFIYGIVSEIYSPDFRPALVTKDDELQDNPITEAMEKAGITKKDIWDRIENRNDFSDIKEKYDLAKVLAEEKENELKSKVIEYLKK